jgi:hypothetical protein
MLFSWLVDSDAFSRSATFSSRSFKCFSFRSRNARWAARFCAFRFDVGSDVRGLRPGFFAVLLSLSSNFACQIIQSTIGAQVVYNVIHAKAEADPRVAQAVDTWENATNSEKFGRHDGKKL